MGRSPCCAKEGLNRGAWTALEDKILANYIKVHGEGRWRILPKKAGLKRCGKSCRLRWLNYLRPDIKRGNISTDEEELIIRLHKLLGNRWSLIAGRLPGRTDNEIKNYWNTNLGKRVQADHQSLARRQPNKPQGKYVSHDTKPPQLDSHVVRTKAIKCSKVVLDPPLSHSHKFQHYFNYYHTGTETLSPLMGVQAPAPNDNIKPVMEHHSSSSARDGLSLGEPPVDNWQDFVMDFDVGELCFSGLLNSEFADLCNFEINNELSPPTNYIPSLMPQPNETLPADWSTVTDCGVQVGHPSYPSFPNNSIPDSRGHLLME